jgi:phospholipase/lecithinase/hemolysin
MKKSILSTALISLSFLIPIKAKATNFSEIYVFGDSLSDTGNLYNMIGQQFPPSPPYFDGRFSNGPLWIENLALDLNLSPNQTTNFAVASASTGESNEFNNANAPITITVPGLLGQVNNYVEPLINANETTDPNALYVVWAGALDYLFNGIAPTESIANISESITKLANVGAKNLLIPNLPDLGVLPVTRNTPNSPILTGLTNLHNQGLEIAINDLQLILENDVNLTLLNIDSLFNDLLNNSSEFGLTNVTEGCLLVGCTNPDEYLFWDTIHPTAIVHNFISDVAFDTINNNPQPQATPESSNVVSLLSIGFLALTFSYKTQKIS